jgi:hypothetical protein
VLLCTVLSAWPEERLGVTWTEELTKCVALTCTIRGHPSPGSSAWDCPHKVHRYKEYHSVCPLVGIGTLPPLSRQRVCPSPRNQMGGRGGVHVGHTRLAGEGLGESQFWRLEKSLALCLLCGLTSPPLSPDTCTVLYFPLLRLPYSHILICKFIAIHSFFSTLRCSHTLFDHMHVPIFVDVFWPKHPWYTTVVYRPNTFKGTVAWDGFLS